MMLRPLYRYLLRLHPKAFRQRYGREMLWIFDESSGVTDRGSLFVDGMVSLVRQWLARPANWKEGDVVTPAVRNVDGVPMFQMVESTGPRSAALLNGMVLSVGVFGTLAIVISQGRPSGVVRLPRVVVVPQDISPEDIPRLPAISHPNLGPIGELVLSDGTAGAAAPTEAASDEWVLALQRTREVVTTRRLKQGAHPIREARKRPARKRPPRSTSMSASTRTRHFLPPPGPTNFDTVSPSDVGTARPADALLALVDQDGDGVISVDEWDEVSGRISNILRRADRDQDQVITRAELRNAMSTGRGP